jgi:glycerol-3-phosphate dehydrogenase (NAD(P)+)
VEKAVEKMRVSLLGAGAWGTTIGIKLSGAGHDVKLWEINLQRLEKAALTRKLPKVLPGIRIPKELFYTAGISEAIDGADILVLAVPCQALRPTLKKLPKGFKPPKLVASLIKGIDAKQGQRPSQIWEEFFGTHPVTVLSGPSIALEVVKGHPTAVVAAGNDKIQVKRIQEIFSLDNLRVYRSNDVVGVELGGALKNVITIACGVAEGLGAGTNTRAALLSRGLAEITRLGEALGAKPRTFAGLAGWGDLVTTAWNPASRNHRVGLGLAQGKALEAILDEIGMVAEGVETCRIARKLGKMHKVEMPITEATYRVLFLKAEPQKEIARLLSRPLKEEVW